MTRFERLKIEIRAAAPAPHDETKEYKRFMAAFAPLAKISTVALTYATTLLFQAGLDGVTA